MSIEDNLNTILSNVDGMVLGGNDLLYTNKLEEHPFAYFVYKYGRLLADSGVDTLFIENHYISEPVQTRGFIGYMMYCAYLFGFRIIGLEFKGNTDDYKRHTGKRVLRKVTTIAYDEYNRILRLNYVTRDIVHYYMNAKRWTPEKGRRKGKYLLFCGMSHVNNEKGCKGIKTLLNIPGIGALFGDHNALTAKKDFHDKGSGYRRPTDYLLEMVSDPPIATRFHINTTIFTTLYEFFFFYQAYARIMLLCDKTPSIEDLWKDSYHAYPTEYDNMIEWLMTKEPLIKTKKVRQLCSIVSTYLCDICTRQVQRDSYAGMNEEHMQEIIHTLLTFIEKKTGKKLQPTCYQLFMDLLFLEKKKMPLPDDYDEFLVLLIVKFKKQLHRAENHLYHIFLIMNSLQLPLPKTRNLQRLFNQL